MSEPDLCTCVKPGGPDPVFRMECPVHGPTAELAKWKSLVRQVVVVATDAVEINHIFAHIYWQSGNWKLPLGKIREMSKKSQTFLAHPEIKALMDGKEK